MHYPWREDVLLKDPTTVMQGGGIMGERLADIDG